MMNKFDLVRFTDNGFELDVRADSENETVWLTQEEMALLFDRSRPVITRHINAIFDSGELDKNTYVHFLHESTFKRVNNRPTKVYSLDVVLSVGYKVNSNRGILFRKWANKILKEYLVKGYSINQKRIETLNKVVDIQNRMLSYSLNIDKEELFKVIDSYTKALDLLDGYDHQTLEKPKGTKTEYVMTYEESREIIDSMKFNEMSNVFGVEKEAGKLNGIIAQVYQNVFGQELYPSVEEKAAHLLYFLVKDHPFADGCKRIAATLFINFLYKNNHLYRDNRQIISNEALVAITILTAESHPDEMEVVVKLIMNLLV
ncbi:MAG: virulence protein RhuM/Fic/DOC family protein [Bacilli bacterium]|nr:virulence protein RhuM/Fic/DOC family protein [Bacilli bacterium]